MWRNLKLFEENDCGDIYLLLDDYLKILTESHNKLKDEIKLQQIKLLDINNSLEKNIIVPYDDLVSANQNSQDLLKQYKISEYRIYEINAIMSKYILDYKISSKKFFNRVLDFYVEKENYEYCKLLQKIINLLS